MKNEFNEKSAMLSDHSDGAILKNTLNDMPSEVRVGKRVLMRHVPNPRFKPRPDPIIF